MTSVDGLVSGINTTDLIRQLMSLERAPQDRLVRRKSTFQTEIKALQGLNTKLVGLRNAARQLSKPTGWNAMSATSSAPAVATVTAGTGALAGVLSFTVGALAQAGGMATSGTVVSSSTTITSSNLLLATGTSSIGIRTVETNGALTVGTHTLRVTQESAGATKSGTAPLAGTMTIDGTNDTINVSVNGTPTVLTLAQGVNLTAAQVAAAVQTASGGTLTAEVATGGELKLTTVAEGSAASIQVTGGTAIAALNLAIDGAPIANGVDGKIDVDGTETTIANAQSGATVTLVSGTGGAIDVVLSGGIRSGTVTAKNVSTGDGSLAAVVGAINGSGTGISAAGVQIAPGQLRLQLTARKTGTAGDLAVATDVFSGALGLLQSTSTASDATLTVGSGPGAYSVTTSSNEVKDLFPGVTLNLLTTGTTTMTVQPDAKGLAAKIKSTVDATNAALAEIKSLTGYDAETKQSGLLMGDWAIRTLHTRLVSAITSEVATSDLVATGVGISLSRQGTLSFDESTFLAKFAEDPTGVAALFQQGGTATSPKVALQNANDMTLEGTYDVDITTAPEQAVATGTVFGGPITLAETIDVRIGGATGTTITYAASAGESLASIASELNTLLTAANAGVVASVEGGALVLRTTGYGDNAKFEVRTSVTGAGQTGIAAAAGVYDLHQGVDVAGSINGVAANGVGQLLVAPTDDEDLAGLTLKITATPAEVLLSTDFGTFTYVRGIGQQLASLSDLASDSVSGTITSAIDGRQSQITTLEKEIAAWDTRLSLRERALRLKFTAMETALSNARNQSSWLAGQIAGLQANSAVANR